MVSSLPSRLVGVTAAGLVAVAMTGCGGGGSEGGSSHAAAVAAGNAACQRANARLAKLTVPADRAAFAGYVARTQTATRALQQQIEAIKPPPSDRAAFARYATSLRRANALLAQLGAAARAKDTGRIRAVSLKLAQSGVGVLAARAGLGVCAAAPRPAPTSG
jgi:hypothetical protein